MNTTFVAVEVEDRLAHEAIAAMRQFGPIRRWTVVKDLGYGPVGLVDWDFDEKRSTVIAWPSWFPLPDTSKKGGTYSRGGIYADGTVVDYEGNLHASRADWERYCLTEPCRERRRYAKAARRLLAANSNDPQNAAAEAA